MYLTLPFPCSHLSLSSTRPFPPALSLPLRRPCRLAAFRHGRFQPLSSDDEPPEIPEDTSHGLSRRQVFERQVDRARRRIEAENRDFPALDPSLSDDGGALKNPSLSPSADLFLDVDQAIYQKQQDLVKAAAPAPPPAPAVQEAPTEDELTPDEEQDLNEINNLQVIHITSLSD